MSQIKSLKELGLSEGEIKVYSAVLESGISSLNKIQQKTGIERRNIYDILNKLIEKGFISYTSEKGKRTYQCTHPNKILGAIEEKENSLKELKMELPKITELFNATKIPIRAEVFRGNESLKTLLEEMLNYKKSYWMGGNSGVEKTNLKIWFSHWMNKRIEKKHWIYDLADYGTSLENLGLNEKKFARQYYKKQFLPKNLNSPLVIAIFGNKVAQILWSDQSFAFVIESKEIKDSFMKYFNYFWKKEKYNLKNLNSLPS